MRSLALAVSLAALATLAGCIVRTYPAYQAPPPSEPRAEVYYYGNHFVPDRHGGGWCYLDGPHTHEYYPEHDDHYTFDQGYYWYRGPFLFSFFGGHPLPGGGWCFLGGPHQHDYYPPAGGDWRWHRNGYVYEGHYRANNPPPPTYWSRPAARQDWSRERPAVRPAPVQERRPAPFRDGVRPSPEAERRPAPFGRREEPRTPPPETRPFPGRAADAPGHGGTPPGRGGTPPGQERRDDRHDARRAPPPETRSAPPAREERRAPPPEKREEKKKDEKKDKDDDDRRRRPGPRG